MGCAGSRGEAKASEPVEKDELVGRYENLNYAGDEKTDQHHVTIKKSGSNTYEWKNKAGVSWTLTKDEERSLILLVGQECPHYDEGHKEAIIRLKPGSDYGIYGPDGSLWTKVSSIPELPA